MYCVFQLFYSVFVGRSVSDCSCPCNLSRARASWFVRAERKLGEMLHAPKDNGHLTHVHNKSVIEGVNNAFKLKDAGVTLDLSSHSQNLADVPEPFYENSL